VQTPIIHDIPYSWQSEVFSENLCLLPGSDLFLPLRARPFLQRLGRWPWLLEEVASTFGRSPRLARCTVLLVAVAAIAAVLQHVLAFISGSYAETRTFLGWMRAAFAERGNLCKDRSYQRLATEPVC